MGGWGARRLGGDETPCKRASVHLLAAANCSASAALASGLALRSSLQGAAPVRPPRTALICELALVFGIQAARQCPEPHSSLTEGSGGAYSSQRARVAGRAEDFGVGSHSRLSTRTLAKTRLLPRSGLLVALHAALTDLRGALGHGSFPTARGRRPAAQAQFNAPSVGIS